MSPSEDLRWMRRALELADRGQGRVAPNPLVGAVVVRDGRAVGEGWHAEYGGPHAEAVAVAAAGERAEGATLYVTLEPCAHQGKTPPCADAVAAAGLARVVVGAADPNPAAGGGADRLRRAGVEVEIGVAEDAARDLNGPFFHRFGPESTARPWIEVKLAVSLDARIADRHGRSRWLTGPSAREEVHRIRAGHQAVAVGIGTALADDPRLTVRGPLRPRQPPIRIVFDRRLRLPPTARLLVTVDEAPVWIVTAPGADGERRRSLESRGVRVLEADDLGAALPALAAAGVGSILCEGGAAIAGALLRHGAVDRLTLFYAPLLLGPDALPAFSGIDTPPLDAATRWRRVRTAELGADTLVAFAPDPCSPES